jgi:hypothetical protein
MEDFDDPLDLLDDDADGVIEMSILEEEEQQIKKSANNNSSGCSVVFFLIGTSVIIAGWVVSQMI